MSLCVTRSLTNLLIFCTFRITPSQHRGNLAVLTLHPSLTTAQGLGLEILLTFVLVFTVFACSATHPLAEGTPLPPGFLTQPLSVGLSVTLAHLVGVSCFTLVFLWFPPLVFTTFAGSVIHPMVESPPLLPGFFTQPLSRGLSLTFAHLCIISLPSLCAQLPTRWLRASSWEKLSNISLPLICTSFLYHLCGLSYPSYGRGQPILPGFFTEPLSGGLSMTLEHLVVLN